jgi:hypothetical protein
MACVVPCVWHLGYKQIHDVGKKVAAAAAAFAYAAAAAAPPSPNTQGPLDERSAAYVVGMVLLGLGHLHQLGIVYRWVCSLSILLYIPPPPPCSPPPPTPPPYTHTHTHHTPNAHIHTIRPAASWAPAPAGRGVRVCRCAPLPLASVHRLWMPPYLHTTGTPKHHPHFHDRHLPCFTASTQTQCHTVLTNITLPFCCLVCFHWLHVQGPVGHHPAHDGEWVGAAGGLQVRFSLLKSSRVVGVEVCFVLPRHPTHTVFRVVTVAISPPPRHHTHPARDGEQPGAAGGLRCV